MATHPPYKGFELSSVQLPDGNWQMNFGIPGQPMTINGATRETHSTMPFQDRDAALADAQAIIDRMRGHR